MKRQNVFTLIILVVFASFLLSCERSDAKVVERLTPGFVKLSTVGNLSDNGGLHYTIGVSQILFLDADEICIYQTALYNSQMIIKCQNQYYFNEVKLTELIDLATITAQQRDWIYNGPVSLRARGAPYTIMLFDVDTSIGTNGNNLYNLSFAKSVSGDCVWGYETDIMKQIFDHVETNKGTIIYDFTIVNARGDFQVQIPAGEELSIVVVKSPDYPCCVRKISGSARGTSLLTWPPMN